MKKKWKVAILLTGVLALGTPIVCKNNYFNITTTNAISTIDRYSFNESYTNVLRGETDTVTLTNPILEAKLRTILGIESSEPLKVNSMITSTKFQGKNCLDLSNTGITDIRELCQFMWPETLVSINLASNGITNSDLNNISSFMSATTDTSFTIGTGEEAKTLSTVSDISSTLLQVNLCFNNIDLSALTASTLNDDKYLWGVQRLSYLDSTKLILNNELSTNKVLYYFRDSDYSYISPVFKRNGSDKGFTPRAVSGFTNDGILGDIEIKIGGVTTSATGYYSNWSVTEKFSVFTISLKSNLTVERKDIFPSITDKVLLSPEINASIKIIGEPNTKEIGLNTVNVRVTASNGLTRVVPLQYTVVDTTAPVLKLVGPQTIYWSRNTNFDDSKYNCIALDSGDEIPFSEITVTTNLDVKVLSGKNPYKITYSYTDKAGNEAQPITRLVYVQEQALDTIILRCNTNQTLSGKEIELEVKPDSNIPMNEYTGFTYEYKWYVNGVLQGTTTGDNNAKSIKTMIFDTIGLKEVKAVLVAKNGSQVIEVTSETLYLDVQSGVDNTQIIIISCSIAILLIIAFFAIRVIIKAKRARKGVAKKSKPSKKNDPTRASRPQITIVSGENPNNYGGSGGGNTMNRLPENNNDNNDDQMGQW